MMLWNKEYQEYDFVVSSVTTKVKGVALTNLPGVGNIVWDVVDYSGPSQVCMVVCTRSVRMKYFPFYKLFTCIVIWLSPFQVLF